MGGLFKSKTKATKAPFESNPWEPQQDYLKGGFSAGQDQLQAALNALKQSGGTGVAGLNDMQKNQINQGVGLGNQAQQAGQQMMQAGGQMAGNLQGASNQLNNIDRMAGQIGATGQQYANNQQYIAGGMAGTGTQFGQAGQNANQFAQGAGQGMTQQAHQNTQAGVQGGTAVGSVAQGIAGLSGQYAGQIGSQLDQSKGVSQGVLSQANGLMGNGSVDGIVGDAAKVADNPYLQGQIDSAIGDVNRGFQNQQAQINANASGAGGMNSTRAALMESKALESAQRTAGNISSGMRSDAYNTGLNTALQNKSQNNSLLNTQLGAGQQQMGINDQQIGLAGQDLSTRLNANNQFAQGQQMSQQARNDGFAQNAQGVNTQMAGFEQLMAGLSGKLQGQQAAGGMMNSASQTALNSQGMQLDASMQNNQQRQQLGSLGLDMMSGGYGLGSMGNQNAMNMASILQQQRQNELTGGMNNGMDIVSKYMQAIGGNYGSNGYQTTVTQSASPFQQILGGGLAIAGAMGGKPPVA